jgi:DNA-3-methyladenine glycosylase I
MVRSFNRGAEMNRCGWCGQDPLYVAYHDHEWGVPAYDEKRLFEMLVLEGAQAGLSWLTILRKRENYRRAYDGFDPQKMAAYGTADVRRLLSDAGIVRNRLKIEAAIQNARAFLDISAAQGSFGNFIWRTVDYRPIQNRWRTLSEIPAVTDESDRMSRDLKKWGFKFVGPTICYAFMQSVGMVNDHVVDCFRHPIIAAHQPPRDPAANRRL